MMDPFEYPTLWAVSTLRNGGGIFSIGVGWWWVVHCLADGERRKIPLCDRESDRLSLFAMRSHPFRFRPIKRGVGAPGQGERGRGQRERKREQERERERERGKVLATHFHVSHGVLWKPKNPPPLRDRRSLRTSDWVPVRGKGRELWTWGRSFSVKDLTPSLPPLPPHR